MKIEAHIEDHGFRGDEITPDMYTLGASKYAGAPVLMPKGHGWGRFKPAAEFQHRNGFDSMNCSNYGTHNAWETLANFHGYEDFPKDCSERYSGVGTGTTRNGNTPHKVAETIRTTIGVIPESKLPFHENVTSWGGYYHPDPMSEDLLAIGKESLEKFDFGHDWVFARGLWDLSVSEKQEKLVYALERGTVAVSVVAWKWRTLDSGERRYIKAAGESDTHWCQLLDYKEGEWWLVYDHYDQVEKKLDWDYDFMFAKVYYLSRKIVVETVPEAQKRSLQRYWEAVWQWLKTRPKWALGGGFNGTVPTFVPCR